MRAEAPCPSVSLRSGTLVVRGPASDSRRAELVEEVSSWLVAHRVDPDAAAATSTVLALLVPETGTDPVGRFVLTAEVTPTCVTVRVAGQSCGSPRPAVATIVGEMSDEWGWSTLPLGGSVVWARIECRGSSSPSASSASTSAR